MLINELHLEPIDKSNWRTTLKVRLAPDQLKFVADYKPVALVVLAKAYVRAGNVDWHPFAIKAGSTIVGIVAITHQNDQCEIFHLVIDHQFQGQGLGKAAVATIIQHIQKVWPNVKTVWLTVHPDNAVAKSIYLSNGFVATGEMRDAEPVLQLAF